MAAVSSEMTHDRASDGWDASSPSSPASSGSRWSWSGSRPIEVDQAFDSFILPLLGLFILPFTTLVYALAWVPGVHLGNGRWLWVALAFVVEVFGYAGTRHTNRDRY